MSGSSGRYGSGGIGMRGPGETKIEINRRVVEKRIFEKEKQLKKLKEERDLRRQKRKQSQKPLVALVGYTNSGKSTLLNTLTKANVLAKDMLFATLDTTTRELWLGLNKEIMVVDTVGFVSNLPHELVDAFSSTLEETLYANLLVNVVDISNPHHEEQEKVVFDVLKDLGVKDTPIVTVYNKIDKVENLQKQPDKIYISAKQNIGLEELKQKIVEILF
ncbi:MAG TPA: GTPase HflX [Clostridiales bacterium]|nr:GTPase HflX [Clostridiales bacterium]